MEQINDLILKADKIANSDSWFNRENNRREAIVLYNQALNLILISREYLLAANVALKISELFEILDNKIIANDYYKKAGTYFHKGNDYEKSVEIFNKLILKL